MSQAEAVPKHAIAGEHLDRAIELYLRGDSFYSALHLGGAAEEILNVYAREVSLESPRVSRRPVGLSQTVAA